MRGNARKQSRPSPKLPASARPRRIPVPDANGGPTRDQNALGRRRKAGGAKMDQTGMRRAAGEATPLPPAMKLLLAGLIASSFAVKLFVAWRFPNSSYPDVTMQYLEQAHRMLTGQGLVPWEYVVGARSWLTAGLIAPGMKLAALLGGGPDLRIMGAIAMCSLFSLTLIAPCFLWGWRFGGAVGAALCGAFAAYWFETVYYAGHPLQDSFGTYCLVPALYLAYPNGPATNLRRLFAAGLLFGLATAFRMQLGPLAALSAFWVGRLHPARYLALGLGGVIGLGVLGPLDFATFGVPFNSILQYVKYVGSSIGETETGNWGYVPWYNYPGWLVAFYSGAFPLLLLTGLIGARRLPLLLAVFLFNVALLMVVEMKSPRYMYPGIPLVLTLSGIGMAELTLRLWEGRVRTAWLAAGGIVFVAVMSGLLGAFSHFAPHWLVGRGTMLATRQVNAAPDACGLAIVPGSAWWLSGGYVSTDPRIPLYGAQATGAQAQAQSAAFNYAITTADAPSDPLPDLAPLGFARLACYGNGTRGDACVWHRPGACTPGAAPPLTASLPDWLEKPAAPSR
ncbi:MAG: hypothetical protein B7Y84_17540 [Azorhizobium sp. 32-67-21]|nr:MAG: hypothetical protein B7Y84_17540 [Azorhizobium sp. 32-67-21]